jgi:hypothetical protein
MPQWHEKFASEYRRIHFKDLWYQPASTPAAQAHSCQSFFISSTPFDRAARIALAFSGRLC